MEPVRSAKLSDQVFHLDSTSGSVRFNHKYLAYLSFTVESMPVSFVLTEPQCLLRSRSLRSQAPQTEPQMERIP